MRAPRASKAKHTFSGGTSYARQTGVSPVTDHA
jgi:hypothetical protein